MSQYLPEPHSGLFPARINRQLAKQDAQAALVSNQDALRIRRSVRAARNGLVGIAEVGSLAGALANEVPWVARQLESASNATTVVIIGHIHRSGD
ncbi:MAG TPA: hypothetical protein VIC06_01305 [Solirubrobacteraceae bacterium]|jgi:hypothetical protein